MCPVLVKRYMYILRKKTVRNFNDKVHFILSIHAKYATPPLQIGEKDELSRTLGINICTDS